MQGRLTDQAAVAVAVARSIAGDSTPTVAHLLAGLAIEAEGRAGRRLRERGSAAAVLVARAAAAPGPPLTNALDRLGGEAGSRAATTVDLLDAAIAAGGDDVAELLSACGYDRDLDGWLVGDPDGDWFDDAETYGLQPHGAQGLDRPASRVVAQVRAVDGGAVEVLVAAAAAPDVGASIADPAALAAVAARLNGTGDRWDAGLDAVLEAAQTLRDGALVTCADLVRAALVAGGDGPKLIVELAAPGN